MIYSQYSSELKSNKQSSLYFKNIIISKDNEAHSTKVKQLYMDCPQRHTYSVLEGKSAPDFLLHLISSSGDQATSLPTVWNSTLQKGTYWINHSNQELGLDFPGGPVIKEIHLSTLGTWVQALVQEDSTRCGTTTPVCHNCWAHTHP